MAQLIGYKGGLAIIPGINPGTRKEWTADELFAIAQTICIRPEVRRIKKMPVLWFDAKELKKLGEEAADRVESALLDAGEGLSESLIGLNSLHQFLINMGFRIEPTVP